MLIDAKRVKNILVVRNDRFGEFLLNIPALRALKETFKEARIIAVIDPCVKDLIEFIPFLDEVILWPAKHYSLTEKLRFVKSLRARVIDIAVMLNPSRDLNVITYLAGIPIRVGYTRKWPFLLTHKMQDSKHLGLKHEVLSNLELIGLIGVKTQDLSLALDIKSQVLNSLFNGPDFKEGKSLIAIHPFTSDPVKQWPMEKFCFLTEILSKEDNLRLVLVGGPKERDRSLELFGNFGNRVINMTGRTNLKELAVLLKKCKLLISGDSGPMHLAAAVGTPVVALFRNDLPGKTARRWGPWGQGHAVIQKNNLADIAVEEVLAQVKTKLNE